MQRPNQPVTGRHYDKATMSPNHKFGGFWTQVKLERVAAYLPFFTREMRGDFSTVYFDAFAGTGTVHRRKLKKKRLTGFFKFPDAPPIDGSAGIEVSEKYYPS